MDWKAVVPKPISQKFRSFGLPRDVMINLCTRIHHDIPRDYEQFRSYRIGDDGATYAYRMVIPEKSGRRHLFTFAISDSAQGFLILLDITHSVK